MMNIFKKHSEKVEINKMLEFGMINKSIIKNYLNFITNLIFLIIFIGMCELVVNIMIIKTKSDQPIQLGNR